MTPKADSKKTVTAPANKGRTFAAEPLTPAEVRQLIGACSRRSPSGIRDAALIAVLASSGLRVSEALALKVADVDADAGTIRVLAGKGGRARTAALSEFAVPYLTRWLDRRAALGFNGHRRLFCTTRGTPLATSHVRRRLPQLGERAGITKRVHAHGLRHSFAVRLVVSGASVADTQTMLGHSSLATTQVYLRGLNPADALEAARGVDWDA